MADDKIKDAEKINGAKYRSCKKPDGYWTDPFSLNDFWSRTFMPKGTEHLEAQTEEEMKVKIKADATIKYKEDELSDESKEKFEADVDLKDKVEKPETIIAK